MGLVVKWFRLERQNSRAGLQSLNPKPLNPKPLHSLQVPGSLLSITAPNKRLGLGFMV